MIVVRSCSPCPPVDPHTNSAISTVDNDKPREEFPGQGGGVQSGKLNEICSFFAFSLPFPSLLSHRTASSTGGNSYILLYFSPMYG